MNKILIFIIVALSLVLFGVLANDAEGFLGAIKELNWGLLFEVIGYVSVPVLSGLSIYIKKRRGELITAKEKKEFEESLSNLLIYGIEKIKDKVKESDGKSKEELESEIIDVLRETQGDKNCPTRSAIMEKIKKLSIDK